MKKIGFLSFGHWSSHPAYSTKTASDTLLQSIDLAVAAEEIGMDGAYFRVHHFARQLASPFPLLAAIGVYAMTLAPVTWVLISEIFPNKIRGAATSVAVIALWVAYAILTFTFPIMAKNMGTYTPFYIYAGVCALGFFFVKVKVKETKGKSLEEMDNVFTGH